MYKLPYLFLLLYLLCKEKGWIPAEWSVTSSILQCQRSKRLDSTKEEKSIHEAPQMGVQPNSSTLGENELFHSNLIPLPFERTTMKWQGTNSVELQTGRFAKWEEGARKRASEWERKKKREMHYLGLKWPRVKKKERIVTVWNSENTIR